MASPAMRPSRPAGLIDPQQAGDYPIILGNSLAGDTRSKNSFLNFRYNWQAKSGFNDGHESRVKKSGDKWQLDVSNDGSEGYQYTSKSSVQQSDSAEQGTTSLALIFDESKSAFVLEAVSATLNMNLKAGQGMSRDQVRNLPQISHDLRRSKEEVGTNGHASTSSDDDTPDASNPYDFRHFLAEARDNAEKSAQLTGSRTPIPGSRTPVPSASTPIPSLSRGMPTTPQFRPTQTKPATKSVEQQKKKVETISRTTKPATKPASKKDIPKSSQSLSKATISDSDDSEQETVHVTRAPSKPESSRPGRPPIAKGHKRNISGNIGSSPHIIINDDDGDLEIDMGSPPPEDRSRLRGRVDPEAFRSHTGTPVGGSSSQIGGFSSRPVSKPRSTEQPTQRERDGDVRMREIDPASEDDDDDVEDFELGSPHETTKPPRKGTVSKDEDSDGAKADQSRLPQQHHIEQAPTPPAPVNTYEDDDEDLLEAALEAAFEEESENQNTGVGLGIGMANGNAQDDESEVSEEE